MDKIFGTVTIDIGWLEEYYPKALQDWIVENERQQAKLRIAFNKKLEKVQYFLDNDTDDDERTLDIKKALQLSVDLAFNADTQDKRHSMWTSIRTLGSHLPNYPRHRVGKEEEE
jgi:hypothetical protein